MLQLGPASSRHFFTYAIRIMKKCKQVWWASQSSASNAIYGKIPFVVLPDSPAQISPYTPRCNFTTTNQGRIHQSRSHSPVRVATTSQGRIHQSESHPPLKVASTTQGRIHHSRSHPSVRVAPTSQGRTHKSGSHSSVKVTPTGQGRTH